MKNSVSRDFNPSIIQPNYLIRKRLIQNIQSLAPLLKGRLMDFGCGQKPYKSLFTVDEYIGVDFENPGHPHANESIDVFYDGKTIPFPNESFDSIFSSEVFEHIFNLPDIIKELNRVLKTGGNILITCPFAFCEHEIPNDYARYTSFAIRDIFIKNGFEIIQQIKTGNSVEALSQMYLTYLHQHINPKLRKIPIVRSAFRFILYTPTNIGALILSNILPKGKDLYMNNVLLCRKINDLTT